MAAEWEGFGVLRPGGKVFGVLRLQGEENPPTAAGPF